MPDRAVAAAAVLHMGEEPPLTGGSGSGAVFFSGCTLGCPFCQNVQISCDNTGREIDAAELASVFTELQARGASNINLVTATQFVPSVVEAALMAKAEGLTLPFMWNSSGYETVKTVKMLSEIIDIWLPDMKTLNPRLAAGMFNAPDYPKAARAAIKAMSGALEKKGGELVVHDEMRRGLILRHLVMPGELESSREVLAWYAENLKGRAMLSLMVQYTSVSPDGDDFAGPGYIIPEDEYTRLLSWLEEYGIEEGFLQEPEAASREWIPDFNRLNPFPEKYSKPVWHWKTGFTALTD